MYLLNIENDYSLALPILIGGALPDILEPAHHYTHRKKFHSRRMLKFLYIILPIALIFGLFVNWVLFIFYLSIGYMGHLWLDASTPMGLPY